MNNIQKKKKNLQKLFKFMASVWRRTYYMNGKQLPKTCSHYFNKINPLQVTEHLTIPKTFNLYLQFDFLWASKFTENLSSFVTRLS